jgi:hypothetical protein
MQRIVALMFFLFFSMFGCLISWGMAGTGLISNTLFTETCGMMDAYLDNKPNEWLDSVLPCEDLSEAGKAVYTAMEAANLAVDEANDVIESEHLSTRRIISLLRSCFGTDETDSTLQNTTACECRGQPKS